MFINQMFINQMFIQVFMFIKKFIIHLFNQMFRFICLSGGEQHYPNFKRFYSLVSEAVKIFNWFRWVCASIQKCEERKRSEAMKGVFTLAHCPIVCHNESAWQVKQALEWNDCNISVYSSLVHIRDFFQYQESFRRHG